MNRFHRHHRDSILFGYSCFDRMILNGCIVPFMHTERGGTIRWFLRMTGYPFLGPREMLVPPGGDGLLFLCDVSPIPRSHSALNSSGVL